MSQLLIDHSPDLKRLRDEGYEIEVKGGYLLIHQIPYINNSGKIDRGTLVSELTLVNDHITAAPNNHVIYFIGEHPCNKDGSIITSIRHQSQVQTLYEGITINHSFSNRPPTGYPDYYQKVKRYSDIISAPAKSLDNSISEKTFKMIPDNETESVFKYLDTNSSRANIININSKLSGQKIAIIGLGGTGSYILDLVSKTPVKEIHLYDGDDYLQHNAFRTPGAASVEQLNIRLKKANYLNAIYSNIHKGIIPHDYYLTENNINELNLLTFVFICVDRSEVRKLLIEHLVENKIPFIDTGLGVNMVDDYLIGSIRITVSSPKKSDHLSKRIPTDSTVNDEYSSNIQIADLNSLNASLAVIKWKKMYGFYQDLLKEHHSTYSINVGHINNEEFSA